jgi:hypothetical protein
MFYIVSNIGKADIQNGKKSFSLTNRDMGERRGGRKHTGTPWIWARV